jgi:chromosome segregation ATPase
MAEEFGQRMKKLQERIWELNLEQADCLVELEEVAIQLRPLQAREQALLAKLGMIENTRQAYLQQYRNFQRGREAIKEIKQNGMEVR